MSMVDVAFCDFCKGEGHEIEMQLCDDGVHKFCPCCDRLDPEFEDNFHDTKEEGDFEWPKDGDGPSDLS